MEQNGCLSQFSSIPKIIDPKHLAVRVSLKVKDLVHQYFYRLKSLEGGVILLFQIPSV